MRLDKVPTKLGHRLPISMGTEHACEMRHQDYGKHTSRTVLRLSSLYQDFVAGKQLCERYDITSLLSPRIGVTSPTPIPQTHPVFSANFGYVELVPFMTFNFKGSYSS